MADDLKIRAEIQVLLKDNAAAIKRANELLKQMDKNADKAGRSLDRAEKAAGNFGKTLTRYLGAAVLTRFVQQSILGFAQFERQLNSLSREIQKLGIDSRSAIPEVRRLFEELEKLGIASQDSARAFQKLLGITENYEASLVLLRTAAGAAADGQVEFNNAIAALGSIIQGEVLEPGKSLNLAVKDLNGNTKTGTEIISDAIDKYAGLAKAQQDTQAEIDKLVGGWNEFKLAVGEGLSSLVGLVGGLGNITNAFKSLGPIVLKTGYEIVGVLRGLQFAIASFDIRKLFTGDFSGIGDDLRSGFEAGLITVKNQVQAATEELDSIWFDAGGRSGDSFAKGVEAAQEIVGRADETRAREKAEKDRLRAEEEERQRAEFALKATESRLRAELALTEEGSEERLKIELEILELAKKRALENAEEIGAGEAEIREAFRLAELKLVADHEEAKGNIAAAALQARAESEFNAFVGRLQAEIAALDEADQLKLQKQLEFLDLQRAQELGGKELTEQQVADIEDKYRLLREEREAEHAERLKAISDSVAQANQQNAIESARVAIAAGRAFFGESKALAYAETIINTAAAAMRAYRQGGWWAAALAIATGAVQLATIRNTDIGGGSEPSISGSIPTAPGTDARRPDLNETQGWRADQPQGRTTTSGNTYVFQGPNIVNDSDMRRFMRKAREVERRDQARRQR
ncbi:MAG: hypothetical protein JSV86_21575 [Gemmatimonadota bacterium]|nr:MAG: hypothetical protein JSV86_21575 [Gemmatimonadota bacterium]